MSNQYQQLLKELINCQEKNQHLLDKKISLLPNILNIIDNLLEDLNINNKQNFIKNFWYCYLPLARELAKKKNAQPSPLIFGILGSQGTGKTTLSKILTNIWYFLGLNSVQISLDDLYKTYKERQDLLKFDSRLIWRGPPLTHDILLGLDILDRFQSQNFPLKIPRFDKSLHHGMGDRNTWETVTQGDIMIFEGWFVGMQPVTETAFINPPHPILTPEDKQFALDNNERLKAYLPLWEKLDCLLILQPQDYRYSLQWRKEAEHKMIQQGKNGMTDSEIEEFVFYFWKALHPEIYLPPLFPSADFLVRIKDDRSLELKIKD